MAGILISRRGAIAAKKILPVTFDAVGAGGTPATVGFNPSLTTSWNHVMSTSGANRCCAVCIVSQTNGLAGSGQTRTVLFGTTGGTGGTAMTSVVFKDSSAGSEFFVEIFYILTSLTGTRQITASVSGGGNTGRALIANSVSYLNVGSVISGGSNSGGASPLSVSGASAINEQLIAAFCGKSAITPTGSNNTRYNQQASGDSSQILIQDSPGTGSTVNFGGTNATGVWAGSLARLQPV